MKRTALALLLLLPLSAQAGSRFDDEPDAPAATGFAAILAPANGLLPKGGSTARLFVYRDDGTPFSTGAAAGSYEPGVEVALPPGTYFAEVARTRTGLRVSKFRVELGKTSVIPTGWVSVTAVERREQPRLNCEPWSADLTVFERDANGVAKMAQSNSHTEHEEFGALQLPVGPTEVVFNGEWFNKMSFSEVIQLNARVTMQQMLQREDFKNRIANDQEVRLHEIQYPIVQGWDSVVVRADVELGGTDQLFNILVGRDLQKTEGMEPQVVMCLPILEGLDGVQKMSKSLHNYVGISEAPGEMFGKLMSISDELMARYSVLLLGQEIDPLVHPMESKKSLAAALVARYHSDAEAAAARENWDAMFSRKDLASIELPEFRVGERRDLLGVVGEAYETIFSEPKSGSDVRRLIQQGSVQLDSEKLTDPKAEPVWTAGQVLKLDKKRSVRIAE